MAYPPRTRTNGITRRPYILLAAAGAFFLVVQVLILSYQRDPSWDEALYLSQVRPGFPALRFVASRSRGIVLLIAPVSLAGASLDLIRVYLMIASSAMLALAYACWVPVLGTAAALAGGLLATTWVALFYGAEVMPNLWSALLITAAYGAALRAPGSSGSVIAAGSLLAAGLVRPLDALVATAVIAPFLLAHRGWRRSAWMVGGCVAGVVPWVIEMSVRLGGPTRALSAAVDLGHVGVGAWHNALQHLALTDGPTIGTETGGSPSIPGLAWWIAVAILCGIGGTLATGTRREAARVGIGGGAALLVLYLFLVEGAASRFLLPAYALLEIPCAVGLAVVWRMKRALAAALVVVGVLWVGWNLDVAARIEARVTSTRGATAAVGDAIQAHAGSRSCGFVSSDGFPQIAYASGCRGRPLSADRTLAWLADQGNETARFVVLREEPEQDMGPRLEYLQTLPPDWRVYRFREPSR
ncbi:MAG TPA: hypothetical protein VFR44_15405 [Actinomycetota bacterium]|nr:hypothetical protein [Actinomycetota bacterium]